MACLFGVLGAADAAADPFSSVTGSLSRSANAAFSGTDSVGAGTYAGQSAFDAHLLNSGPGTVTNAVVDLSGGVAGSHHAAAASVDPGANFGLGDLTGQWFATPVTLDVSTTRSVAPGDAPPGDSTQTVSVTVDAPTVPFGPYQHSLSVHIVGFVNSATASDSAAVAYPAGTSVDDAGTGAITFRMYDYAPGTYTFQASFTVHNPAAAGTAWKPTLEILTQYLSRPAQPAGVTGITMTDDVFGTVGFGVDQPVDWDEYTTDSRSATLDGVFAPPSPSYSLSADPADLFVRAGESATTHVSVAAANGFANTVGIFLNGAGGGPTPPGIHQSAAWPSIPAGDGADVGIAADIDTAPGDYPLLIVSNDAQGHSASVPVTLHVAAGLPRAQAVASQLGYVNLSGDSVANQSYTGTLGFRGDIQDVNANIIPSPRIDLDTYDPAWTFTPTPSLPSFVNGPDLTQGQELSLRTIAAEGPGTSRVDGVSIVTGFHGSRDAQPAAPAAGTQQLETIAITIDDPSASYAEIDVFPRDPSSPPNGNVVDAGAATGPVASNGEFVSSHPLPSDGWAWTIGSAKPGTTYTVQVPVSVAQTGTYKPFVILRAGRSTSLGAVTGPTATIFDPTLGGTWAFSSSTDVTFQRTINQINSVNLQAVSPPPFTVSYDSSVFDVRHTWTISPNATVGSDAPGNVSFFLTGDAAAHGVTVSGSIAPGSTGAIQIRAGFGATPGSYTGSIGASAPGVATVFTPVTINVLPYVTVSGLDDFTAQAGSTVHQHLTITPEPGFAGDVHFVPTSMDGLTPLGWDPVHVDSATGSVDVDLPFSISPSLAAGDYIETFQFDGGFKWAFALHVTPGPTFSLNIDQTSFSGPTNSKFRPTITVNGFNGFTGPVSFSLVASSDDVPPSASASGTVDAGSSGQIIIRDSYPTPLGTYHLRLQATAPGAPTVWIPITLTTTPYFVPSGNDDFTAAAGKSVDQPLTLLVDPGYTGDVSAELGTYVGGVFTPGFTGLTPTGWTTVHVAGANASIDLPFTIDEGMAPGDYLPAIRFNGPGNERIWLFALHVQPAEPYFTVSYDRTLFSGPSNSKFRPTVTVSPHAGFTGPVTFSLANGVDDVPPSTFAGGTVDAGTSGQILVRDSYPTPVGTYRVMLVASSPGAPSVVTLITLTVEPYFVPSGNDQFTANAGATVDQPLSLVADAGYAGTVTAELGTYDAGVFTPGFTGITPVGWTPTAVDATHSAVDLPFAIARDLAPGTYTPAIRFNGDERIWLFQVTVEPPKDAFVHAVGTTLAVDGGPFRPIGLDMYQANSNGWCGDSMDGTLLDDAFTTIAGGGNTVRAWFFQQLATTGGARDWTRFDHTLAVAKAHHLRVVATLVDEWGDCGASVAPGYGKKTVDWYAGGYRTVDPIGTESYRDFAADIARRYRSDPTIMAWQLVNEPEAPNADGTCPATASSTLKAFASDVSGVLRDNDPNHLISLGTIGSGQCGASSDEFTDVMSVPTLDLCEFHDYNPADLVPGDQWNGLARRIEECNGLNKPLLVGELGIKPNDVGGTFQARANTVAEKLCAQTHAGVAGVLLWNWRTAGSLLDNYDIGPGDPVFGVLAPYTDASYVCAPPSAPRGVVAAAGDGTASVSWSTPASAGGAPVSSYTVVAQPGGASQTVSGNTGRVSFTGLTDGTAYTFAVSAVNGAGPGAPATSSAVTPTAGALPPTTASAELPPGGVLSSSASATAAQPVAIAVQTPTGGTVSLATTDAPTAAPSTFDLLGQQVQITAPPASPTAPLTLTFVLDQSLFADGTDPASVAIFRDGVALPACTGPAGTASPDACVASRTTLAGGDVRYDVLSSHASLWGFGVAGIPVKTAPETARKLTASPGTRLSFAFAFNAPGEHAAGSAVFSHTSLTFTALCGARPVTFSVSALRLTLAYGANGTGWLASGEATFTVPDACGNRATMTLQDASLATVVRTTRPLPKLLLRWHYALGGVTSPWSTETGVL